MPRVTVIDDYIEGGISDAIEWIIDWCGTTDREDRTLDAVVDPDQTANRGKFTVTVPSDLYAAPQPNVNITRGVPVVVGFIKYTQGTEVRQSRFLMILRAGA